MIMVLASSAVHGQEAFVTTWKTDNEGSSCSSCVSIPTVGGGYSYNVDWENDGVIDETGVTGTISYEYASPGIYTIAISGEFPRMAFDFGGDKLKLLSVEQWGEMTWQSMNRMFAGCENLIINAMDNPDLSEVTNLSETFSGCINLEGDLSDWDVSNVQSFSSMFSNCRKFNEDISSWNTSSALNISGMFSDAVTFDQDISQWDVSNVTLMSGVFNSARSFNQDLNDWEVSNVTDMFGMFNGAIVFNGDISKWDVSNVTDMGEMFGGVNQVVFPNPSAFNQDISQWNVSNVTNMADMFLGAESFNQDVSQWDVSSVTSMQAMFRLAESFDQDLSQWNLSSLSSAQLMFNDSGLMCNNYSAILAGWANNLNTPNEVNLGARNIQYEDAVSEFRDILISKGWEIQGDEQISMCTSSIIDNSTVSNLSIRPNPASQFVEIIGTQSSCYYSIFNSYGQQIREGFADGPIYIEDLDSGLYILNFSIGRKEEVLKLIKI